MPKRKTSNAPAARNAKSKKGPEEAPQKAEHVAKVVSWILVSLSPGSPRPPRITDNVLPVGGGDRYLSQTYHKQAGRGIGW